MSTGLKRACRTALWALFGVLYLLLVWCPLQAWRFMLWMLKFCVLGLLGALYLWAH